MLLHKASLCNLAVHWAHCFEAPMQNAPPAAVLLALQPPWLAGCSFPSPPTSPPHPNDRRRLWSNSLARGLCLSRWPFLDGQRQPAQELAKAYPSAGKPNALPPSAMKPRAWVHISRPFTWASTRSPWGSSIVSGQSGYQPESVSDGTGGYGCNPA